jgi:hypothetical protein
LQRQKEAHELKLEELKGEQNRQIETLRADIGHLQDRGKLSNEREYAALTEIWDKFSDLHTATSDCVMSFRWVAAAIPSRLHQFERSHAVRAHATEFTVGVGCFDLELGEGRGCRRILGRPVEAEPRKAASRTSARPRKRRSIWFSKLVP